jgi:heme exporter protein C
VHTSLGIAACLCALVAMAASVRFLWTRAFPLDSVSVAAIEIGLAMLAGSLASSGRAWDWSAGATAELACGLLYTGYLILRHAVEEPTQRAVFCAVFSIFAFFDIPIVAWAVNRWTSRHPHAPVPFAPSWPLLAGLVVLAVAAGAVRFQQEEARRELDSLRRTVHAF